MNIIELHDVSKAYGAGQVLDRLDLEVAAGEVFGLLGPNGAGKTTPVEILEGYRRADSGRVRVLGFDPADGGARFRSRIGIVLQQTTAFERSTVRETVEMFAGVFPSPMPATEAIDQVGLGAQADRIADTMSGGQRRRLDVACGLVGRPDLLFLDEPTTGLDPEARRSLWNVIRRLRDRGCDGAAHHASPRRGGGPRRPHRCARGRPHRRRGHMVLLFSDVRWSIFSFGVYAVCYTAWHEHPRLGIALAGVASAIWIAAWLAVDAPAWTATIPLFVVAVGSAISLSIERADVLNREQQRLIEQLRDTRLDLAASERSKGVLEERARVAGEIHDTLAQGFTSIVLLGRAAQRSGAAGGDWATVEAIAQQNLDASRRLVEAMRPAELESDSLQETPRRHVSSATDSIPTDFRVIGTPRPLPGAAEVTILRAAPELTANATAHADADHVDVTLSYLDDAVVMDVSDDGAGFVPGTVADRGSLSGGQGLDALARRVETLAGRFTIESGQRRGSVLSVIISAGGT